MNPKTKTADTLVALRKARELCSEDLAVAGVRLVYDLLADVELTWHPDDNIEDIKWDVHLDDEDIARLIWIDNSLIEACGRLELDIYEESMQSHVRVHGDKSCFWPEHRAFEERRFLCTWEGYSADGTIQYEEHGLGWFCKDRGYEDTDIDFVKSLSIGDTHTNGGPCDLHTVLRIK